MPSRRSFLATPLAAAALHAADGRPPVTNPRATSGDRVEPNWSERLTVTVGPAKADLTGTSDRVLQAAVDYVARLGGGTVKILPGTYTLRNAVYLASNIRIVGSGADSVLVKAPSITAKVSVDSDWYDQEVTLADARGFQRGRRRLPAGQGRARPAARPCSSARWWPAAATASSSTSPCAKTSGR
jgi:hypothetical protein